jgi:DNA-binding SARP family transcriptional activator
MGLQIQILGQVRAWRSGEPIDVGSPAQRGLLALLALSNGRPQSRAELVDAFWGDEPPASAANVIQAYVKRLRLALEPERHAYQPSTVVPRIGDGYALQVAADAVDLARFRQLSETALNAQRDGVPQRAIALLRKALDLWQGRPLADIAFLARHPKVIALTAERHTTLVRYGQMLVAGGNWQEALPVLEEATADQPLDEIAHAHLIRACHLAGQRARAFATYHTIRRRLADELGVDPGPELAAAHDALLRENPQAPSALPPTPVPAQLPTDIAGFTGRADALAVLDEVLVQADGRTAVVISAISGTAGVGKTALAVHWAQRVRGLFPDGQLYVNLRGFDPAGQVMDPADALRGFLDALHVPSQRIPASTSARTALYRSLLAGRRVLLVLDNARDAEQVRPLLPGASGCLVLVTSRHQLTGLVAAEGANPIALDLLTYEEAGDLLARRLGRDRTAAEADAVAEIIDLCARLPLALSVVSARAAFRPGLALAVLAAELRQAGLDALDTGDTTTTVRAAFSWSYGSLTPAAARLFRLLGLHPGPGISAAGAASLAGLPIQQVRPLLAELAGANLICEPVPGRFAFHDLLRAYAAERVHATDSDRQREAATRRMLDHYLHTAYAGARVLNPARDPLALSAAAPGTAVDTILDSEQALAWFDAEHAVLLAMVRHAETGWDEHVWHLAWSLLTFLRRRGHWHDNAIVLNSAVAATQRLAETQAQAWAHRTLGGLWMQLDRFDDAETHLQNAVELAVSAGDHAGQAHTLNRLAFMADRQGRYTDSLKLNLQALDLYRIAGHRVGHARALNAIGWSYALLGNYETAIDYCQQALTMHDDLKDLDGQADAWDSLGYANRHLGRHAAAITSYRRAAEVYRDLGDRYNEADTLARLGDTHADAGDHDSAGTAWQQALVIFDDLEHPDAELVRGSLSRAGRPPMTV